MKKLVLVALIASLLTPVSAQAAETKFVGGPLTNLDFQGATVNIQLSNVPAKGGLYIQQCVEAPAGTRSALCNKAVELWISTARGASFLPTAAIAFKPTGSFVSGTTTVDCTVSKCGIFIRFDHTVAADFSEDQFFPLTFKAAVAGSTTLAADEVTATINGVAVTTRAPATLGYRQSATVAAVSKAGAPLTYRSLAPACALNGQQITPLAGAGECAISVTSAGNAKVAPVTVILPIRLVPGSQTLGGFALPVSLNAFSKTNLPTETNFGEKVTYKAIGSCSVVRSVLTMRRGQCEITATSKARKGLYEALSTKLTTAAK
ncbi:MAG: hypothetical protein FGM60_03760 [Candidatus Planktophila sp.]|nr:hypothetical protein [Candidatus Planktophila sp.]